MINPFEIDRAVVMAIQRISKLSADCYNVPALSSLNIRNLMNNLGAISTNYLEVGVHKGGLFCSTICNNELKSANAVDNWLPDGGMTTETTASEFLDNARKFIMPETRWQVVRSDSFAVDFGMIDSGVDLFLYDAAHDYNSQKQALIYYKPVLADEFIYCCDDWSFDRVKEGTFDGIKEAGYKIIYDVELKNPFNTSEHQNDWFWRGFYVALLLKK